MSKLSLSMATALATVATLHAQAPTMQVSIGVRENGIASGLPYPGLGLDGGAAAGVVGGIEWVNLDGQSLLLDGTWQPFVFNLTTDPITGFAGTTANGIIEGTWGTLENLRIRNNNDVTRRVSLWIDDWSVTITPTGGSPTTTTFQNYELYLSGDQVTFQEPCYSGSTHHHFSIYDPLAAPPRCVQTPNEFVHNTGVDTTGGFGGSFNSLKATFQFLPPSPLPPHASVTPGSRWARLTSHKLATFAANNPYEGNAAIPFDQQAVVMFWMRGEVGSESSFSGACPGVPHSGAGPLLTYAGSAAFNDNLILSGSNQIGLVCALLIGNQINPGLPLDLIGGIAGSQLCVAEFANVPCLGQPMLSISMPIGSNTSIAGLTFAAQLLDFDPNTVTATLPFGTSNTVLFTPGNF